MKTIAYAVLSACLLAPVAAQDREVENPEKGREYSREFQLVFHAVLEGLFEDGVAGEALELIVPDPKGMLIEGAPEKTNFVYACPLCTPAFNAFRLYAARSPFYGQKATKYTTFGPGMEEAMLQRLKLSPQERREVVQELIQRWVGRRLDRMALSDAERAGIEANLKEMKEKGDELLKRFQEDDTGELMREAYRDWKKCPVCAGAVGE